jgi:acyl carrier protein
MESLMNIERLYSDIAEYFNVDVSEIGESTVAADIIGWDSLSHVMLVLDLEEKYDLEFSPSEISNLKNVGDFYNYITNKKIK